MADDEGKGGEEREIPSGLPAIVFVGAIVVSVATLSLLLVRESQQTIDINLQTKNLAVANRSRLAFHNTQKCNTFHKMLRYSERCATIITNTRLSIFINK